MKFIFNSSLIKNNEILFFAFLVVILSMIIFAGYKTYKVIKNDNK